MFATHSSSGDHEHHPVVVRRLAAHRVIGVLQQLVDEAPAVVVGNLRLLTHVLLQPRWGVPIHSQILPNDVVENVSQLLSSRGNLLELCVAEVQRPRC